ncbi:MAG: DUF1761 domain-containing protein [Sphingomonadales bacterium]|nr:DUF1761 domain-containing protein [Sphingomonadales bacterium]
MGAVNWFAVVLGTVAFFAVGAVWYGVLFTSRWQREVGVKDPPQGSMVAKVMGLTLLCEFLVVSTLGHLLARTQPTAHVKMMMAMGFAVTIMAPAIGINYIHQRRSLTLFLIDAGHFLVGMAAAGAVFIWLT